MESQAQLSQQHPPCRSQTPCLQSFNIYISKQCGVWAPATCLPNSICMPSSQLQQKERQWQRAYRRRPTPLETQEKTTETETRSPQATVYACSLPGKNFPAIFGCQPINLELYPLMHAYPANYLRVHLGISGYIKRVK